MQNTAPKKILFFAHDSLLYGASLSLITLLEYLSKDNSFEIMVLLPYGGIIEERLKILKINYKIISFPRCVADKTNSIRLRIRKILNYYIRKFTILPEILSESYQFKPDLVYTNTSVISIGHTIAQKLQIPHIWHIREFGGLDFNFNYLPCRLLVKNYIKKSTNVIFASKALLKHWVENEKENYKVVYNGIELKNLQILPRKTNSLFRFGLLGAILPGKGQYTAIKAFISIIESHSDCELHFYGDIINCNYYNELKVMIDKSEAKQKIEFHSFIPDNRLIYNNIDILLNCSCNEGFGRTIIEAMGLGIPVIANANGGPLEIIDDGINGLLFNGTPESLLEKMIIIISDNQLYRKISENARQKVLNYFSAEKYVEGVNEVISKALQF